MPQIYLCFLWHMHQPFYKDLSRASTSCPGRACTRSRTTTAWCSMLEEFPKSAPDLQPGAVHDGAGGGVRRRRRRATRSCELALKPAEDLTEDEREFLLQHSFHADPARMIYRYPRYGELFDALAARRTESGARNLFGAQEFRDLQVLSQLAWFDEDFQANDRGGARAGSSAGRNFTLDDQRRMGEKQREIVGHGAAGLSRSWPRAGQIEISTTPFYHPDPAAALRFQHRRRLASQRAAAAALPLPAGRAPAAANWRANTSSSISAWRPVGLWPSEGSVSDEVLRARRRDWASSGPPPTAACSPARCGAPSAVDGLYRPYAGGRAASRMQLIFRDHFLSDLIGFVYSKMDAAQAADDFLHRIRAELPRHSGQPAATRWCPIILDGENAWEYYHHNGRPFLRELYRRISRRRAACAPSRSAKPSALMAPEPLDHIFPGLLDQRQLRHLDRRRGRQPGLDAPAARARRPTTPPPACPRSSRRLALRGTADRRRQRLVLVVRPGARFRQPPGVRPALPQPSGQRLPLPESGAARRSCRGRSCASRRRRSASRRPAPSARRSMAK